MLHSLPRDGLSVASGYAHGPRATPQVAIAAVSAAMARAGLSQAGRVYLFLSAHFQHDVDETLRAVTQISGSLDIFGASAAGVFSEQDWSLDAPAAAALVLPPAAAEAASTHYLALAAPNTINQQWLNRAGERFGGVAGDASGHGAYALWHGARQRQDHIETPLSPRSIIISQGFQALSRSDPISDCKGLMLNQLAGASAYASLKPWLTQYPLHHLMAGISLTTQSDTQWIPVIGVDEAKQSIMLASELPLGAQLCWGHFDSAAASRDLAQQLLSALAGRPQPRWSLVFSGHRRGMAGSGLQEPDWNVLRAALPGVPFAGFYGNGQIVPLAKSNRVVDNSVLVALFD